ncbi:MAG: tetratricopeptide repeat protein, partial [Alphaproteobacteria bacterium]|nr:tetratricopeptide repeat protein [Alphaproteobacteria bacterium]
PNNLGVKTALADFLTANDHFDGAIGIYDEILKRHDYFWQAEIYQAESRYAKGNKKEAIKQLEELALSRPSDLTALYTIARFHSRDKEYEKMAEVTDRLIKRINTPARSHWSYFYYQGMAYERLKQWPRAEEAFLKALELSPDEPDVLNYLGYSWVDKGMHLIRAQEMLKKAVNARRTNGAMADSLGWAYFKLEKYEEAVTLLERAVALEPGEAVIVEHLGDAYWKVGRKREARFQWNRALKWPTEDVDVEAVRKKLTEGL